MQKGCIKYQWRIEKLFRAVGIVTAVTEFEARCIAAAYGPSNFSHLYEIGGLKADLIITGKEGEEA